MAATTFPAFLASAGETTYPFVVPMVYAAADTSTFMDLVVYTPGSGTVAVCGANPASITGFSLTGNPQNYAKPSPYPQFSRGGQLVAPQANQGLVAVLSEQNTIGMCVSATPAATNVGVSYGILKSSAGVWQVNFADTVNTRVRVIDVDPVNGVAWVRFLAANLTGVVS